MKRKLFVSILSMIMSALLLAGCGQTNEVLSRDGQTVQDSENNKSWCSKNNIPC